MVEDSGEICRRGHLAKTGLARRIFVGRWDRVGGHTLVGADGLSAFPVSVGDLVGDVEDEALVCNLRARLCRAAACALNVRVREFPLTAGELGRPLERRPARARRAQLLPLADKLGNQLLQFLGSWPDEVA